MCPPELHVQICFFLEDRYMWVDMGVTFEFATNIFLHIGGQTTVVSDGSVTQET